MKENIAIHQYLNGVITNIPFGIVTISKRFEISMLNSRALSILELKKDVHDYLDIPVSCLFEDSFETWSRIEDHLLNHKIKDIDFDSVHYNKKFLNIKIRKMLDGTLLIIEDISTQIEQNNKLKNINEILEGRIKIEVERNREQDKQLLQQSRLAQMGEMISMIAHQWRQPLGAISTTTANLKLKIDLDMFDFTTKSHIEETNRYIMEKLEDIDEFVQNLTGTIDDFRNFYKPNKQAIELNLKEIVDRSLRIIQTALKNENIELIVKNNSNKLIKIYENELMQVVLNIIKNSQDNFRERRVKNPKIMIEVENNKVLFYDNGGGISETIIEKIFDPYFSTKNEKNGTGLGLYMSKIIVEDHHNGKLEVQNIDEGVCFTIILQEGQKS